jgi:hypothetical protein
LSTSHLQPYDGVDGEEEHDENADLAQRLERVDERANDDAKALELAHRAQRTQHPHDASCRDVVDAGQERHETADNDDEVDAVPLRAPTPAANTQQQRSSPLSPP